MSIAGSDPRPATSAASPSPRSQGHETWDKLEACDCGSAQEDNGWACRCTDPPSKRKAGEFAASTERREQGFREFKWWLAHPRLYRLVGFRWLCWRYRDLGVGIPDPRRAPQEAIDLGRELARKHGW